MASERGVTTLPLVSVAIAEDPGTSVEPQQYSNLEVLWAEGTAGPVPSAETLERARGELVVHVAPGDTLLPTAVATLAAALADIPTVVAAYPAYRLLGGGGHAVEEVVPEELDLMEMLRFQRCPAGPAPIFRRKAALEVARALEPPARPRPLAFWLHLAARGQVRRLTAPLATRRVKAPPPLGGPSAAGARLRDLERLLEELELPEGSEAAATSAARSACVLAAAEIEPGLNVSRDRFFVVDRFAPGGAVAAGEDLDAEIAWLEAHVANLEQRLARQRAATPVLEAAVAEREATLAGRHGASGRADTLGRLVRRLRGDA